MRSIVKIKSPQNCRIALLFNDMGKSCPCHKFVASQICLLTLFGKIRLAKNSGFSVYKTIMSWPQCKLVFSESYSLCIFCATEDEKKTSIKAILTAYYS